MTSDDISAVIPRWDERERLERERGNADGSQVKDPFMPMEETFSLSRLDGLDHERSALLPVLRQRLNERKRGTKGELSAHEIDMEQVEEDFQRANERFTKAQQEVSRLERFPSQRPGDGYPSSLAIDGGGLKASLRKHGVVIAILLVLLCVEIPIYYETFLNFGDSRELTFLLAVGAILVFVFGPHFYGRKFREWQEEGRISQGDRKWLRRLSVVTIPPVLWLVAISSVAYLRLDALTSELTIAGSDGGELSVASVSDDVGFFPVLCIIVALMVFTALIALEIGRRMGNPIDTRLKELRVTRDRARAELDRFHGVRKEAARRHSELGSDIEDLTTLKFKQYEEELRAGFDRLEVAYAEAFMLAVSDKFPRAMKGSDTPTFVRDIVQRHREHSDQH